MNMHERSDNNQGMEWEKPLCVREKEMEKVLGQELVFVRLETEEHSWCVERVTEWQKVSEEVMQAKERENESKQSGCEIILQEIKPVGVCTSLGRESVSVLLHNKGVTELIWVAWSLCVCVCVSLRGYWGKWPEHSVCSHTIQPVTCSHWTFFNLINNCF